MRPSDASSIRTSYVAARHLRVLDHVGLSFMDAPGQTSSDNGAEYGATQRHERVTPAQRVTRVPGSGIQPVQGLDGACRRRPVQAACRGRATSRRLLEPRRRSERASRPGTVPSSEGLRGRTSSTRRVQDEPSWLASTGDDWGMCPSPRIGQEPGVAQVCQRCLDRGARMASCEPSAGRWTQSSRDYLPGSDARRAARRSVGGIGKK